MAEFLKQRGFKVFSNVKIDIAIVQNNTLVIFEIKSTTVKNYLDQMRTAVVQLFENEFIYSPSFTIITKVAVFEHLPSEGSKAFVDGFLEFADIAKVYYDRATHTFLHLDGLIADLK